MQIYLVTGNTGEYEDRFSWEVKAFRQEEAANAYVKRLEAMYGLLPRKDYEFRRQYMPEYTALLALDPEFGEDTLTGTYYTIHTVEFVE